MSHWGRGKLAPVSLVSHFPSFLGCILLPTMVLHLYDLGFQQLLDIRGGSMSSWHSSRVRVHSSKNLPFKIDIYKHIGAVARQCERSSLNIYDKCY